MSENEGRNWAEELRQRSEEREVVEKIEILPTPARATRSPLSDAHYEAIGLSIAKISEAIGSNAVASPYYNRSTRDSVAFDLTEEIRKLAEVLKEQNEAPDEIVSRSPITEQEPPRFLHEIEDFPKVVEILHSTLNWLEKLRDEGESMRNEICEPDYLSEIKKIIHVARVNAKSFGVDLS